MRHQPRESFIAKSASLVDKHPVQDDVMGRLLRLAEAIGKTVKQDRTAPASNRPKTPLPTP